MALLFRDESRAAYREALRQRVCAICLDAQDDGRCAPGRATPCVLERDLEALVSAILSLPEAERAVRAAASVEAQVCGRCADRDASGACARRRDGRCAVAAYLPLIVEAVDGLGRRGRYPA